MTRRSVGGGGTPLFALNWHVLLNRVWFLGVLKQGVQFCYFSVFNGVCFSTGGALKRV